MPDIWTIKGQAGKAIDETERTLAQIHASGMGIDFRSLYDDELTWNAWLRSTDEIGALVPDYGQRVSIYKNGVRFFTGHVTGRVPTFTAGDWGYSVTVSGPWYWLAKTPLSSEMPDETTVLQERAAYIFPTGSPTDHLISIASRAIELGMPISLGTFATCADVPRLSLREMSLGEAISEIMRLVVDGHVYFDYSGPDGSFPRLCMQRRTVAASVEIPISLLAVPDLKLKPRYDLQISELKVNYADRETYNLRRVTGFKTMTAGLSTGEMPDRQIITVTGPELDTFLPQDLTDSVVVKSSLLEGNIGAALCIWHDLLKAGEAEVTVYESAMADTAVGITTNWPADPMLYATDSEGEDIDLSVWTHYLTKGEIKDWFEKDGIESIQARITATVADSIILATTADAPEPPKWARILGAKASNHFVIDGGTLKVRYVWQTAVSAVIPLVKTAWLADTTLIRQEDWGWFNPPEGFAEYLLETQNWIPWEGTVPVATDDSPPNNAVGSVLNITGWVPEAAEMRAMISGYSVTPATGQITFTLGPPARHAYRDLVNRFRQSGADNIFWLGTGEDPGGDHGGPHILTQGGDHILTQGGDSITTQDP